MYSSGEAGGGSATFILTHAENMSQHNVVKVPPRRRIIRWKGLHGTIEYRPALKVWQAVLRLVYPIDYKNEHATEAAAELDIKKQIETALAGKNKNVSSRD